MQNQGVMLHIHVVLRFFVAFCLTVAHLLFFSHLKLNVGYFTQ